MTQAELEICISVCSGDQQAFEQFFRIWYPRVFAFCTTFLQDETVAMDVAQDSFIEMWRRRESISNPGSLVSYLFKMVKHRCVKEISSKHALLRLGKPGDDGDLMCELDIMAESMSSLDELCRKELHDNVSGIVGSMPARSRDVMLMRLEMKMTSKEIADKLGLSVRTVENEYFRAIRTIRNKMKEQSLI